MSISYATQTGIKPPTFIFFVSQARGIHFFYERYLMNSIRYRKCGKKNCIFNQEGHPGHGPQYLWNATIKCKSYAKSIPLGPELEKCKQETDNHREFTKLCEAIVLINERICGLRPAPEVKSEKELAELKKKLQRQFMGKSSKR
jgi:hypothetical protein